MKKFLVILFFGAFLLCTSSVYATPVFYGPTEYFSAADIPTGFYIGDTPTFLEDFEDGNLGGGITASAGAYIIPPLYPDYIDSVDGDDGSIDGSGSDGHTMFSAPASASISFTFSSAVTAAGIVWTDGYGLTTFEAYNGIDLLGSIDAGSLGTYGDWDGDTDEDRFFGVQYLGGITEIRLTTISGNGIEVDHVQYGAAPVPEPATMLLLGTGLVGLAGVGRKKFFKK